MLRTTSVLPLAIAAACLCFQAVRPSGGSAQQPERRDSAGVVLITYAPEQLNGLPVRRAEATPTLSIGAVDGPPGVALNNVLLAISHRDGGVVLADDRGTVIRRYDSEGRLITSSGRAGDGPGEFRRITGLAWLPGDSLVAYERLSGRVSVLGPDLRFVRSLTLPPSISLDGSFSSFGSMNIHGLGTLEAAALANTTADTGPRVSVDQPTVVRDSVRLVLLTPAASPAQARSVTLGVVPGSTLQRYGTGSSNVQFAPDPLLGGNQTGFFYTDGARFEVRRFEPDGRQRWVFRVGAQPRRVSDSECDQVRRRIEAQPRPANMPPRPPVACSESYPLIRNAFLDAAGNVWLQPDDAVSNGRGWLVIAPDGQAQAWHTDLPDVPLHIGADHVLGITRDELGAERIVKHRIGP